MTLEQAQANFEDFQQRYDYLTVLTSKPPIREKNALAGQEFLISVMDVYLHSDHENVEDRKLFLLNLTDETSPNVLYQEGDILLYNRDKTSYGVDPIRPIELYYDGETSSAELGENWLLYLSPTKPIDQRKFYSILARPTK